MTRHDDSHIQETHFFRNPRQYEWIAENLPRWLRQRNWLRVWSAGCASGAELYSLLILLEEGGYISPDVRLDLLGTDRDPEAVTRARRARFTEWELRGLSPERRERCFQDGTLKPELAQLVRFECADLLSDPAPADCQLVFCRNVLIYYRPVHVEHIMATLAGSLAAHGTLLLGYAEAPQALACSHLELQDGPTAAFRRPPHGLPELKPAPAPVAAPLASRPMPPTAAIPDTRLKKALVHLDRGEYRLAMQELRRLTYNERRHAAGHYYLGLVWRAEGEHERARRHFRTALEELEKLPPAALVEDVDLTCGDMATLARWQLGWMG